MSPSTGPLEPHPSVVFTRLSDAESVLLHLDSKRYYSLNETGARIWALLQELRDPGEIALRLDDEYELDGRDPLEHVDGFLDELQREGLVRAPVR